MCLRCASCCCLPPPHGIHPGRPQLWTIMPRQQLLLPVSLYDWFSHTIWLFNNCAEDMKRTPASSHQCHCQRASVPMATKGRKREGEKREERQRRWPVSTIAPRKDKSGSARTKKSWCVWASANKTKVHHYYFLDLEYLDCYFLFYFKVRPFFRWHVSVTVSAHLAQLPRQTVFPPRSLRVHSFQLFFTCGGWIDAGVNSIDPNVGNCIRSGLVGWDQGIAVCRLTAGRCLIIIITIIY